MEDASSVIHLLGQIIILDYHSMEKSGLRVYMIKNYVPLFHCVKDVENPMCYF